MLSLNTDASMKDQMINITGKTFQSPFVHKYMIKNCKYKGGDLGKSKHGISFFPTALGAKKIKNRLGNDQDIK